MVNRRLIVPLKTPAMNIKKKLSTALLLLSAVAAFAQTPPETPEFVKDVKPFNTVIASPRINVILQQGETESVRIVYSDVSAEKINVQVKNHILRIYLSDAKVTERMVPNVNGKVSMYRYANVTAYVTYKDIEHLEIRGNQELTCKDPLKAQRFILKAYGENSITLASVKAEFLKANLYGENKLYINGGMAEYQKYKLIGENRIDTRELKSYQAIATIFGESKVKLSTQDQLNINAFGEAEISYNGDADVNKRLVVGRTRIRKLN